MGTKVEGMSFDFNASCCLKNVHAPVGHTDTSLLPFSQATLKRRKGNNCVSKGLLTRVRQSKKGEPFKKKLSEITYLGPIFCHSGIVLERNQ